MNFQHELKKYFTLPLLLPLFLSSVIIVIVQSAPSLFDNATDDIERITTQALIFITTLTVGGFAKFYFFYILGKKTNHISIQSFKEFFTKLFLEWIVIEIRVQLRTLFYLLLLIVPGVVEALRLSLSPVHVFFNSQMEDEEFDPIHASRDSLSLTEKKNLSILFLINAFVLGMQLLVTGGSLFQGGLSLIKAISSILIITLTSYLYYIYISYLYSHYDQNTKKDQTT